jgi:hypothetical protein
VISVNSGIVSGKNHHPPKILEKNAKEAYAVRLFGPAAGIDRFVSSVVVGPWWCVHSERKLTG